MRVTITGAVLLALLACSSAPAAESSAEEVLNSAAVKGGLVVHLGCGDGKPTADLRANDRCLVQARDRSVFDFDWKFTKGDFPAAKDVGFDDSGWREVQVPHDWSIEGPASEDNPSTATNGFFPGGVGWYRKHFQLSPRDRDKKIIVEFDGIYMNSDVWINGHHLGHRCYGYISFYYDLTPYLHHDAPNVIAVRVDNSHQPTDRWYSGCGIYRHVWLTATDKLHIPKWGTYITTPRVSQREAVVRVETKVVNESASAAECTLLTRILYDDKVISELVAKKRIDVASTSVIVQEATLRDPKLWSPGAPNLYKVATYIKDRKGIRDQHETVFGIRKPEFIPGKGFFLNGRKMVLKGVNIHHDAGCLGAAVPDRAVERRLKTLKEMGCNAIRLSHNPHSPELLDMCDRMGLMLISEYIDKWDLKFEGYGGKTQPFMETWELDVKEWVDRDKNHPSVILWSLGNETVEQLKDPERGVELLKMLAAYVKKIEPSRKITCAMHPGSDWLEGGKTPSPMIHHMDVVSYNYRTHDFDAWHKQNPEYLFIAAETQAYTAKWPPPPNTLDYSRNSWFAAKDRDYVVGHFIWAGIDYLGESKGWPDRACPVGQINTCGFRKPHSFFTQSIYSEKPMVYLAVHDDSLAKALSGISHIHKMWYEPPILSHWNIPVEQGRKIAVYTFTNCVSVELLLNGRSLGVKSLADFGDRVIRWDVPFEKGTIKAIGRNAGESACEHRLRTAGPAKRLELIADRPEIAADGQDVCHIEARVVDANGLVHPYAENLIEFDVKGEGRLIGVDNGDVADHFDYKGKKVSARGGKCLAIVQSTRERGQIVVQAKSSDLKAAEARISTK